MVTEGSDTQPKLEHRGYNRGLILGLTMAESMLLLVFCLLLVAAALISAERNKRYEVERKLEKAEQQVAVLEKKRAEQAAEIVLLQSKVVSSDLSQHGVSLASAPDEVNKLLADSGGGKGMHDWPPIINLDDGKKNYFQSGSAELTGTFSQLLSTTITDEIASNLSLYGANIVEVIGHTDEQPVAREKSNLDDTIISAMDGRLPVSALLPADNAGLGLARAIAVANVLRANPKLKDATILPMSAAQLILPGDTVTSGQRGAVESRRRIEIRVRGRTAPVAVINAGAVPSANTQ